MRWTATLVLVGLAGCIDWQQALDAFDAGADGGAAGGGVAGGGVAGGSGGGTGGGAAGGADAGSDGGPPCDLAANTGCSAGLRCAATSHEALDEDAGGTTTVWSPRCLPPGAGGPSDPCSSTVDAGFGGAHLTDTCGPQLACFGAEGCRRICNADGGCPGASVCTFLFNNPTGSLGGVCLPTCNLLTQLLENTGQNCGQARGCYAVGPGGANVCARAGVEVHGTELFFSMEPRAFANACVPGAISAVLGDGGIRCVALCQPTEVNSTQPADAGGVHPFSCAARGAASSECHYFWQLELEMRPDASVTPVSNAWGFCSDPAFIPGPRCVTLDAGDHVVHGCAPR